MLQAKMSNGKLITLANLPRNKIEALRNTAFYCPSCHKPVMMKVGSRMIPHFSHYADRGCLLQAGGEGIYHEQGKLLIYNWLNSQHLDVALEAYLPTIHQRPDILLTINKKKIAIEYQCARIPIEEIRNRNQGYLSAGIIPLWILGEKRFSRKTSTHINIDAFTLQFIHQFSVKHPTQIFYFCPHTLTFIIVQDIVFTGRSSAVGKIRVLNMKEATLPHLFTMIRFARQELFNLWEKEKKRFRTMPSGNARGTELAWRRWLYHRGTNSAYLPSVIYLPTTSQYRIQLSPWNWQSRIYLDVIEKVQVGNTFSSKACEQLLKRQLQPSSLFPLMQSNDNPILSYLSILESLQLIKQVAPSIYKKQIQMMHYKHVEDAVHGDKQLLKQLGVQRGQNGSMIF
ncbi:competence protein CoiA [Oceanobacillus bengalensis]|uniref:Competence protein CoiA n=1 Tax=Oceanobacillus bengalensis TaxID=1435466 RepID=A0A494YVH8_9BACI|nr:competence protein CoiA family protein [Oceanobacillus bengalensis]RKQ14145.1 hypothetical protein D8M05_14025 [Oceanobacillus bengalensis]